MTSPTKEAYDALFWLYMTLGVAIGGAVLAWLIWAVMKYRSKEDGDERERRWKANGKGAHASARLSKPRGSNKVAMLMVAGICALLFGLTIVTMDTIDLIEHVPPDAAFTVKVTGMQFAWEFTYPGGFHNMTLLRVPAGKVIRLEVTSKDVMHNFAIPDYRIKTDAIPGQVNTLWIQDDTPSEHDIHCMELCGVAHGNMFGTVIVMAQEEFDTWRAASAARRGGI